MNNINRDFTKEDSISNATWRVNSLISLSRLALGIMDIGVQCNVDEDRGCLAVAPGSCTTTTSKGCKIFIGSDYSHILMWSGIYFIVPLNRIVPSWVRSLLIQPEESYFHGALTTIDTSAMGGLGLVPAEVVDIYGPCIDIVLSNEACFAHYFESIQECVAKQGASAVRQSFSSMKVECGASQIIVDAGLNAWGKALMFSVLGPHVQSEMAQSVIGSVAEIYRAEAADSE